MVNTFADVDTTVHLGSDTTVQHSLLRHAQVGRRCRLLNSVIEGHPEAPVIIGDDVTLMNCHVQSTGQRSEFSFCNWRVSQAQTRLGHGVSFSNSRLLNTVVEDGSSGFSASIEYSHIGPRNTLRSFTNMTHARTAEACNLGSEVSKTLILGAGFTSEHYSSYLSLVAPADYPIVTAEGREEVLTGLPNVSNIGAGSAFSNYGGEMSPAPSIAESPGSAKGTAVVYTAFLCINCRVVNRYGQPTGQPSPFDLLRRRDLTILGFGSFVENKLTGRIPAFSYANDLTPRSHSLGWVLAKKPGLLLNFIKKMQQLLAADAGRLQELVQGTLRLECRLLQAEFDGQRPTFYSREQLRAGLDIMQAHLHDRRWAMDETGNWLHPWCFDTAQGQWVSSVACV
ncbi:hypothetical protein NKDENANG_03567 [Candidatus Entotheonellaceae bacterium PAL068K]